MKRVSNVIMLFVLALSVINPLVINAEEITLKETENINDTNKKDNELTLGATDIVNIPDPELESCIRNTYPPVTGDLTVGKLEAITTMACDMGNIKDLSGIENLKNLEVLALFKGQISDVEPLASLSKLKVLWIMENSVTDISPLANLTNLENLDLHGNQITDFSPLSKLNNLTIKFLNDQTPSIDLGTFNDINDIPSSFPIVGMDGTKYDIKLDLGNLVEGENIITTYYSFDSNLYTGILTTKLIYHSVPKINGVDDIKIELGTAFDPMEGVSASDIEDGDLTTSIKIIYNDLDTTKAGTYTITYSVTDSDMNTTEISRTITVVDNTVVPPKPEIDTNEPTKPEIDTNEPKDKPDKKLMKTGSNLNIASLLILSTLILVKKTLLKY